jgi:hypothetical protein
MLTTDAAAVPMRMRDPVCPVCSRPIKNGAAAIELAGPTRRRTTALTASRLEGTAERTVAEER